VVITFDSVAAAKTTKARYPQLEIPNPIFSMLFSQIASELRPMISILEGMVRSGLPSLYFRPGTVLAGTSCSCAGFKCSAGITSMTGADKIFKVGYRIS
jgi:hypothetical protein